MSRGEEHIVHLKIDTNIRKQFAVQYKLLRILKDNTDEKKFINSLILIGLTQLSRIFLRDLLNIKGMNGHLFNELFKVD